jgi:hypothetical protein
MAENDVFIEGGNWPAWASEATLKGLLASSNVNLQTNAEGNKILSTMLKAIVQANSANKDVADAGKKQADAAVDQAKAFLRQSVAAERTAKATEDNAKANDKIANETSRAASENLGQGRKMSLGLFGGLKAMALEMKLAGKTEREQLSYLKSMDRKAELTEAQLKELNDSLTSKGISGTGVGSRIGSAFSMLGDFRSGLGDAASILSPDSSLTKILGGFGGIGMAAYGAVQGARSYATGQIEGRFDMVAEMRQSGLFSAIGEMSRSFEDMALEVNQNMMTLQEATEFTRQFSRAVGVIGVRESLGFVNTIAEGRGVMEDYNLSFAQVATLSGTYMETLERLGMLETMNARTRERGMLSFVSVVESTAQTLKVSMEDAAKMISEYLGRDDISAMIMTAANQLSPEMQAQIGQMGNMGPLGEIIAMGAIDPQRFMLTDEYQALMNPALSGVRGIIEQMQSELAMGGNAADITARYSQQLADIVRNDPVVGQLVAMDDEVARLVSGIQRFSQTAEDSTNSIVGNVQETDRLERQRQEMLRRRDVTVEQAISSALANMDLKNLLESEIGLAASQINLIKESGEAFENLISGVLTSSIEIMNNATAMLLTGATNFLEFINEFFPKSESTERLRETVDSDMAKTIDNALYEWINGMDVQEMQTFLRDNQDIANDPQAFAYLIRKNQELLDDNVGKSLENQTRIGFATSVAHMGMFASEDQIRQAAEAALSETFDTALTNSIFSMSPNGTIQQITDSEVTGLTDALKAISDRGDVSEPAFTTIVTNLLEKMEERKKGENDPSAQADIARLIATMQSLINNIN